MKFTTQLSPDLPVSFTKSENNFHRSKRTERRVFPGLVLFVPFYWFLSEEPGKVVRGLRCGRLSSVAKRKCAKRRLKNTALECRLKLTMTLIGTVENGKIALPAGVELPSGTQVKIETLDNLPSPPALAETLKEFVGIFDDLPQDLARNHDYYLHGAPKK
jgi:hypothetical protein